METYLGIDGGGSKTRARLVDANGRELHYAESGPSNLNAYDEATVRESLSEVVHQCVQASGSEPSASCLGLAGAGNPETRKKLESIILPLKLGKTRITSDAAIALEGAFTGGPGMLLIVGTGSVCLAKSPDGTIHQCGGWGWLADDAGSAGWIGQRALASAVQQHDGRIEGHALRDTVFNELGIKSSQEISAKLHQPLLGRSQIAELARIVFDLAEDGDAPALLIQNEALHELEKLVRAAASKLDRASAKVVLTGGLLSHNPSFRKAMQARLSELTFQEPESTQLDGAVTLARKI